MPSKKLSFFFQILAISTLLSLLSYSAHSEQRDLNPIETKVKELAVKATMLAKERLTTNSKDPKGLTLTKFAHHFYPKFRPLLLLRARLKYKIQVQPPIAEKKVTEDEFLVGLRELVELASNTNIDKNRHLLAICYNMIRVFRPEDEDSLVILMAFEDAGIESRLEILFNKSYWNMKEFEYDPKDPRYIISNCEKAIVVPANQPWTDTWIKVQAGKVIRIRAERLWGFGEGPFPSVDADGFENLDKTKTFTETKNKSIHTRRKQVTTKVVRNRQYRGKHEENLGCLLARIGKKHRYAVGQEAIFTADGDGILYLGPNEWGDYSDNSGNLLVTVTVSDK